MLLLERCNQQISKTYQVPNGLTTTLALRIIKDLQ